MKNKVIWVAIIFVMSFSFISFSYAGQIIHVTAATISQSTGKNWWDKFGQPKYGGTLNIHVDGDMLGMSLDPYSSWGGPAYFEGLWIPDWTLDRNIWGFKTVFTPTEYWKGNLAESWEQKDPTTLVVHLHKGVRWQNKAPVNGREFTADDVEKHYDRILGTGSGYKTPSPFHAARMAFLEKVIARDKYIVVFKYKYPTAVGFLGIAELSGQNLFEAPEWVALGGPPGSEPSKGGPPKGGPPKGEPPKGGPPKGGPPGEEHPPSGPPGPPGGPMGGGPLADWKNGVGTGPWILTDYISGSSITYTKNPDYWGTDERYPGNKLPYADILKQIVIPDISTAIAAIRTGKIDFMWRLTWQQARSLSRSNPKLLQSSTPSAGQSADLTADKVPFNDIKVRKAMQMAINIDAIAKSVFGGTVKGTPVGMFNPIFNAVGWGFDYKDWPRSLKDEYSYNPKKAKALLKEAGYPNGFKTNIVVASMANTELVQIMKSQLNEVGIDMEIKLMDGMAWMPFAMQRKHDQMNWDPTGKTGAVIPPHIAIAMYSKTDMANFGNVDDPKYEAFVNKFNNAPTIAEAKKIFKQADQYALEQHWALIACPSLNYNIWQPSLKGYSGEVPQTDWFWSRVWKE